MIDKYFELAETQFYNLKESVLDEDRKCVGAESEETYLIGGVDIIIKVSGFWEKSDWFDWYVYDSKGDIIYQDTEY